ncbi:hypothetical protein SAMN05421820_114141 [Pedobacter steynii]|uniref:dTDP-4-amino-4,6-dideoxygalactose transaminase n=1 Tax=Pedobacter steynii TaxID=430522 RepID=A0A1H0JBE3_9SPHI|nr:hypothetical protein [Pedobacter steynii]NQX43090.1 hypothetical protein [Pedobacter steynii]SDO41067.1 hypothetical protein SAMN05421820_114141 [Pedobacter steynii]
MRKEHKTIGGYIELQLPEGQEHYPSFIKLNTGRNALEYLLRIKKYTLVYLPYFTCEVLLEPLRRLSIPYRFYRIDRHLDPVIDFELEENAVLLYTNYFGIKQDTVHELSRTVKNLIIDNAQAFFHPPVTGVDTFYSCRKFFGVPDGAYLYTESNTRLSLESDISVYRFSHLIKSIDLSIETGYHDYLKNNIILGNNPIKKMSVLSQRILSGINYEDCCSIRNANFQHLHQALGPINQLPINLVPIDGPMVYPLVIDQSDARKELIAKKIFVATYWPNVLEWASGDLFEHYLTRHLLPLPVDHRYGTRDMDHMIKTVRSLL